MRLYLAGPMTGIEDFNFPAFNERAEALRQRGYDVANPAENDGGDTSKEWAYYLRKDLRQLLDCDSVAVLKGWRGSKGASLEVHVARTLGMPVLDAYTLELVSIDDLDDAKESVLHEGYRLVHSDRGRLYGHPYDNFSALGRHWGATLTRTFDQFIPDIPPETVGLMLVDLKVDREAGVPHRDNRVDGPGYFECVDMIHDERKLREESDS